MIKRIPKIYIPEWAQDWLDIIIPGLQILLIVVVAMLLQYLLRRLIKRVGNHYQLPRELLVPLGGLLRWTILASALLLILERLGVSATVLWTAFTGFATVGAVAFFAAWSVLSNLFCALLIYTVGPFRVGDTITGTACANCEVDVYFAYASTQLPGGAVRWEAFTFANAAGVFSVVLPASIMNHGVSYALQAHQYPAGGLNSSEISPWWGAWMPSLRR